MAPLGRRRCIIAYNQSAYQNLLFGVSQQAPQDRLPGQLSAQINMTSDLVGGLRRRAPVEAVSLLGDYTELDKVRQYNTDIGSTATSLVVDAAAGRLIVTEENSGAVLATFTNTYLTAAKASSIRMATLDDAVWIGNTEILPQVEASSTQTEYPNPENWGYFYTVAGAYSKTYNVTIQDRTNSLSYDLAYTTPDGTASAHVAQSTVEYIAQQLATQAAALAIPGLAVYRTGAYVAIKSTVGLTISSTSGSVYLRGSNAASIRDSSELPARLPLEANNLIIATGTGNQKTFYRYTDARKVWVEDASWPDMQNLIDMPIRLTKDSTGTYVLEAPTYERRAAGDNEYNPALKFITDGFTGMTTFQGRLVFLSNEYVCMSASDNPLRYFRSTMSTLADNDPIEVAAQGSLTAPYEWATNFNKDLILWSRRYQGVVPGSSLVTPRTANVAVMTTYEVDTSCSPTAAGRSVFFGAPRSLGYVGIHEMVPSTVSDNQYVADDVTNHIPRYIPGPWRFLVSSTTSNIMVGSYTGEPNNLLIHEYLWNGGEKVHHAWSKWTFNWPVIDAYFSSDVLVCLFGVNGKLLLARLDLQRGAGDLAAETPRLDYSYEATCTTAGQVTVPSWVGDLGAELYAFKISGDHSFLGQRVFSSSVVGSDLVVALPEAEAGDVYVVGYRFTSSFSPSSPTFKDSKGVPITTTRGVLHQYRVSFANTGEFKYTVGDSIRTTGEQLTTPLRLFSAELGAGQPLAATATKVIPARVDLFTATLVLETDDFYDLNVRSIEYGFRYVQRFRRM